MRFLSSSFLLLLLGCSTVGNQPIIVSSCPFEQVWDSAIAALDGLRLESADKSKELVETDWTEVPASSRAGLFQREVNKERFKYIIQVKREDAGATASVQQIREQWTPMGVRMRQWRPMPSDVSEEAKLSNEISRRLKEKGC